MAPWATQAQVGIAMGTGTDVAMESARVTLVKGDLRGIAYARRLMLIQPIDYFLVIWFVPAPLSVGAAVGGPSEIVGRGFFSERKKGAG